MKNTILSLHIYNSCAQERDVDGRRSRMRSSVPEKLRKCWQRTVDELMELDALSSLPPIHSSSEIFLAQTIETYMMSLVCPTILPWFKSSTAKADRAIHLQIMCLRDRSQTDFRIPAEFQTNHDNAIHELCLLPTVSTPVEKLVILKNSSTLIRQNIQMNIDKNNYDGDMELATDDLISIIIWVIVQASRTYLDVPADIRFIMKFHFVSSSCSHLGFSLCNFRVAIAYLVDLVKISDTVTIVSNSIMTSPASLNQQMFDYVEDDFQRKPVEEISNLLQTAEDILRNAIVDFQSNMSISSEIDQNQCASSVTTNRFSNSFDGEEAKSLESLQIQLLYSNHISLVDSSMFSSVINIPTGGGQGYRLSSVSCGYGYFAVVDNVGQVYTWGESGCGRLGSSLTADLDCPATVSSPTRVNGILSDVRITSISCGKFHSLALSDSGQLYSWGDNRCGQMGISSKTIMPDYLFGPSSTEQTALVVKSDKDSSDKTFIGPLIRRLSRTLVTSKTQESNYMSESSMTDIAFDFAAMQDVKSSVFRPRKIVALRNVVVTSIACGAYHCLCLSDRGIVYSWGRAANGRLGQNKDHLKGINEVSNGSPCLFEDDISYGEPNLALIPGCYSTEDEDHQCISIIAAGHSHSIAVTNGGEVYTWGMGTFGRLGHGEHCDEYLPRLVRCLSDVEVRIVNASAGYAHSIFLSESGQIFGCGLNEDSQLDALSLPVLSGQHMSKTDKVSVVYPLPIILGGNISRCDSEAIINPSEIVTSISCGDFHTVVTTNNFRIIAWGRGFSMKKQDSVKTKSKLFGSEKSLETPTRNDAKLQPESGVTGESISSTLVESNKKCLTRATVKFNSKTLVSSHDTYDFDYVLFIWRHLGMCYIIIYIFKYDLII